MRTCPACGAVATDVSSETCWMCEQPLPIQGDFGAARPDLPRTVREDYITLVGLFVLLLFVVISVTNEAPGLGIALGMFLTPVLVRTILQGVKADPLPGETRSAQRVLLSFVGSIVVIVTVGVAATVAFHVACWGVCLGEAALLQFGSRGNSRYGEFLIFPAVGAGIAFGLFVGIRLLLRLWPRRRTP